MQHFLYDMNVTSPFAFRYYYKFIVNGQWKHSTSSPAERDDSGNVNNIIMIGETASVRPSVQHQQKVCSLSTFAFGLSMRASFIAFLTTSLMQVYLIV